MQELGRELEARCNHGVVIFENTKTSTIPDYSVTVRGKTIWLEFEVWADSKRPLFSPELEKVMDKMFSAFYVHIITGKGKFEGVWVSREVTKPCFFGPLGEAVRYLTTFFDLDTTDLDY